MFASDLIRRFFWLWLIIPAAYANDSLLSGQTPIINAGPAMYLAVSFIIVASTLAYLYLRQKRENRRLLGQLGAAENIIQQSGLYIYEQDADGRILSANRAFARLLKMGEGELPGKYFKQLHDASEHWSDRPLTAFLDSNGFHEDIETLPMNDGSVRHIHYLAWQKNKHDDQMVFVGRDVTDYYASRQQANRSQELFNGFFEAPGMLRMLADTDGRITDVNHHALEFFQLVQTEVVGMSLSGFLGSFTQQLEVDLKEEFVRATRGEVVVSVYKLSVQQGKPVQYLECRFLPLMVKGKVDKILFLARDATEQQSQQEKLALSDKVFRAVELAQNTISRDESLHRFYAGILDSMMELADSEEGVFLEYSKDREAYLSGKVVRSEFAELQEQGVATAEMDQAGFFAELVENAVVSGQTILSNDPADDLLLSPKSHFVPMLRSIMVLPVHKEEKLLGVFLLVNGRNGILVERLDWFEPLLQVTATAISSYNDRKKVFEAYHDVIESERNFRTLIETGPDITLLVNRDGVIELASENILPVLGYAPDDIIGQNVDVLVPGESREKHPGFRQAYLLNANAGAMGAGRQLYARHKNGDSIPIDISLSRVEIHGEVHVVCSVRDATVAYQLREELKTSAKLDSLGKLTGGLAHDFNNLLGLILGNCELAQMQAETRGEENKFLGAIRKAAERGSDLTSRMLAFARKQPLSNKVLSINDLITGFMELLQKAVGPSIEIEHSLADDLWDTYIDANAFENAILNLSVNARDAMPEGGNLRFSTYNFSSTVESSLLSSNAFPVGDYVVLTVTDTGCGMSEEVLASIFEPLFTTKDNGKGTGLGLAMVHGFVVQSGGAIKTFSAEGFGTTFQIFFPRAEEKKKQATDVDEVVEEDQNKLHGTERVLVVDDEVGLVEIVVDFLNAYGYDTVSAYNADSALELFENDSDFDVLVTDIVMPGSMNGVQLAKRVTEINPKTKVVLVSGFPKDALKEVDMQSSPFSYLPKPYTKTELIENVRKVLKKNESTYH